MAEPVNQYEQHGQYHHLNRLLSCHMQAIACFQTPERVYVIWNDMDHDLATRETDRAVLSFVIIAA